MASGGEDTFIAIWRFTQAHSEALTSDKFEFQVQNFQNSKIVFDSMIIGHEGWINSLQWNSRSWNYKNYQYYLHLSLRSFI